MKRVGMLAAAIVVWLSFLAAPAMGQSSTGTISVVNCGQQFPPDPNYYVGLTGSITPVPSTEWDLSIVSSVQGEVLHLTLPAGLDISGFILTFQLPLGVVTATAFQDLHNNDVQDPGEPTIAIASLDHPCEPQRTADCKDGGWRDYPWLGFKNQGDCVSYVATGYWNPPAGLP